jgi:hypothetical protein
MTQNIEPRSQAAALDWLMLETTKHQSGRGLAHLSRSLQQEREVNKRSQRIGGLRGATQIRYLRVMTHTAWIRPGK